MSKLESRLATLEKQAPVGNRVDVIHITFMGDPAVIGPRVVGVKEMKGDWRLPREPGEDLEAFRARAKGAAPRSQTGVTVILDEFAAKGVPA